MEFIPDHDGSHRLTDERVTADVAERDGAVVVTVSGKLFYDTLSPLADALSRLTTRPALNVVLDLSAVPMCDSSGLNLFVRTRSELTATGGRLRVAGTQPLVDNVLRITNLDRVLPRHDTVEDALSTL